MKDEVRPTKTFLLGVGAQKSGTSWLYYYLSRHPQCAMGRVKEYAVFDTIYMREQFGQRSALRLNELAKMAKSRANKIKKKEPEGSNEDLLSLIDNIALELDPDRYVDHFERLLLRKPKAHLVGDITPEYSALSADHYSEIRNMLIDAGFDVRVVFLMRDPVERCYSMLRMGDRNKSAQGKALKDPAHVRFSEEAVMDWCEIRTRYDKTIPALEAAFRPDELFYAFYEEFISAASIKELTTFLGIRFIDPDTDHMANRSPRDAELSAEAIAKVRSYYEPVYTFCKDRFGSARIEGIWPHA
ncbi:MAG TPA: sulfotransferase [Paracoccus sp.]|nr:sulfotransferase [Paracoccus sp. (in: a-proteobacteria)]